MYLTCRYVLLTVLLAALATPVAANPLVFHYPDSGAPPWLYLLPGESRPTGLVNDLLEAAASRSGRELRYAFQPRENSNQALRTGSADGAMFFSVTRAPEATVLLSQPVLPMESVLVTLAGRGLAYQRPLDLRDKRLCTLTDEAYPPLELLAMNGTLLQRKAKTEQAQLMMLRNEDCLAAVISGPIFRWLAQRYRWQDLRTENRPLLTEQLLLGFASDERRFAGDLDELLGRWRASGELSRAMARHLKADEYASRR